MPLPPGPHSYVLLWTQDYCNRLRKAGDVGEPLEVVYGGSHTSQPLISRYGVQAGDTLYTVSVKKGSLLVIGGMTVDTITPWRDYVSDHLGVDREWLATTPTWDATARLPQEHPDWGHRLPWGCTVEAVVGHDGAELSLDRVVPSEVVSNLFFVAKNGTERQLRQVQDGRITSAIGLQGHALRLRKDAAVAFAALTWPRR